MKGIYKSAEGERLVRERYLAFLDHWPVAHRRHRMPTSQGETFVVAFGVAGAPALVLLHGGAANSAMWMDEICAFAEHFRVFAIDMIGEPGLSAPSRPRLDSDAHAVSLDEALRGLAVERASMVGVSRADGWRWITRRGGRSGWSEWRCCAREEWDGRRRASCLRLLCGCAAHRGGASY